jgi:hypothetical protein
MKLGSSLTLLVVLGFAGARSPATESSQPAASTVVEHGRVTVRPPEYPGAINNPLMGFRAHKPDGFGLLERKYIKWSEIELGAGDSVDRIVAHTNRIAVSRGRRIEDLNVKLVPRVYLDWNGTPGRQHWPADLHPFDYDSPEFQARLRRLVAKLGAAWDNDPRIFAVQMGLIGRFGEHHNPAPTAAQRRLLADAFKAAFKHKPVLVRHNDPEFMAAGFGIYYDTFANLSREPPDGPRDQFPWQATHVYRDQWKRAPIEGEVEYNWQKQRPSAQPERTFGRTPDETMTVPAYRRHMIDKIRRYHASYLGWISSYTDTDRAVVAGAAEIQQAFGYRFVLESVTYPHAVQPGARLDVTLAVRNTGSAPFYLDWPVAVALLDPATRRPVWSAPLAGVDLRRWLPGEDWDSAAFAYRVPAATYREAGYATLSADLPPGRYLVALAILDRQGGLRPSARFATGNYFRGGWHPLGHIGVGAPPPVAALEGTSFDNPAFDDSLRYAVPAPLLAVPPPPPPAVTVVTPWRPDPRVELIDPRRYWILSGHGEGTEKLILRDEADGGRVVRVAGQFGPRTALVYPLGVGTRLEPGRYRFAFRVRGTPGLSVEIELNDGTRRVRRTGNVPLTETWRDHIVELSVETALGEEPFLRFVLPRAEHATFDLAAPRLRLVP